MITLKGTPVCGGVAFGKLKILQKSVKMIKFSHIENIESELEKFENALQASENQLKDLYEKSISEVGKENAMIFEIHRMMLKDKDYINSVRSYISDQKLNAEGAVAMTADNFADMFSKIDDSYMQARATDVRDISDRIISNMSEKKSENLINSDSIIGALDLAPSETVQLDKTKILSFVTERGSENSHTSILARTMNIPAIIGVLGITKSEYDGADVIVDGFDGTVYINPNMETVLKMQKKKDACDEKNMLLQKLKGVKPITKDGKEIMLYANIGSLSDMPSVYANDAMGIGLFRSEFIYLQSTNYPSEDTQFEIYKSIAQKAMGKRVIIRTLDIGADKQVDYFDMPKEENPALGVRAIRICLTRPEIFKTQLRALYRASVFGKIAIMFPMINTVEEIKKIKEICSEVKDDLTNENLHFARNVELGIMIETPSSAIISDKLSKEVDFFSIGTNDLTQYTMAVDRQNPIASTFADKKHLSILRLIKTVTDNAHKNGIWVGMCGELASDLELTETFLAMGIDELSVTPSNILPIKKKILETDISKVRIEL